MSRRELAPRDLLQYLKARVTLGLGALIYDFIVIGGGIVGLAVTRELRQRHPRAKIAVVEKEPTLGSHASGRNSGVLHTGIYYPPDSMKARFCARGRAALVEYCQENELPLERVGKVILPVTNADDHLLAMLAERARINGARAEVVDAKQLAEIEPRCSSITGRALWVPEASVVDPRSILSHIADELRDRAVGLFMEEEIVGADVATSTVVTRGGRKLAFGHLFNCAGLHSDIVARHIGIGTRYRILPFRGSYYKLTAGAGAGFHGHVYPVPNLGLPFLGVHFTKCIDGAVTLGPTAMPALGREHYAGMKGMSPRELPLILGRIAGQYLRNPQGFRDHVRAEMTRLTKGAFVKAARALVPSLTPKELGKCEKVGIRAQLYDREEHRLVMDFLVERGPRSTHVLNAVSPGFTCSFAFAQYICEFAGI